MTDPLLLAYYGDDFTGSTDALEALTLAGIPTALFLQPPTPRQLARFPGLRAIGVAGVGRSLSPDQMTAELTPIFRALASLAPRIVHYKLCSTFDSSPAVGSIGRAIEIGIQVFDSAPVPLVVGAPGLGRYCLFGNLFARAQPGSDPVRLDRHPTMSRHPVTPMHEADLRLHLAKQTSKRIALVDVRHLGSPEAASARFHAILADRPDILLIDVLQDSHLLIIGRLLWDYSLPGRTTFIAGSSAVESALCAHLKPPAPSLVEGPASDSAPIVVISGSCSPVTAAQIAWALSHGYADISLSTAALIDSAQSAPEEARAATAALAALVDSRSPIIHTAVGPHDPRLAETARRLAALGTPRDSAQILGCSLGRILARILRQGPARRAVIAGGDTSGYVGRALNIEALQMIASVFPGAPLCRAASPDNALDGIELSFKGGQVGPEDFFERVRQTQS